MAWEHKEGQGSLFKNSDKKTDNHPDMKGDVMINGQMYYLNAWEKKTKAGAPYFSVSVKPKTGQAAAPKADPNAPYQAPAQPAQHDNLADDLPF